MRTRPNQRYDVEIAVCAGCGKLFQRRVEPGRVIPATCRRCATWGPAPRKIVEETAKVG